MGPVHGEKLVARSRGTMRRVSRLITSEKLATSLTIYNFFKANPRHGVVEILVCLSSHLIWRGRHKEVIV